MKLHLFIPSVSRHVLSNFWNAFLLIVSTILPKPTTCLVDSKLVFVKVGALRIRLPEYFQQLEMVFNSTQCNAPYSKAYDTVWREKLLLHMLDTGIPSTFIWSNLSSITAEHVFNSLMSLVPVDVLLKVYCKVPFSPLYSSCSVPTT